jgi:hypothetical protein
MTISTGFMIILEAIAALGGPQNAPELAASEAESVVQKFAQYDFEGYRLDSQGHQAIWQLTIDNGAPPESPLFVVKGYKVGTPIKASDGSFRVPLDYDVIGLVVEDPRGFHFKHQARTEKVVVPVKCARPSCRVDLDRRVFRVSPHVGKRAILAWLKGLEGIQETEQEKQAYRNVYNQVRDAK